MNFKKYHHIPSGTYKTLPAGNDYLQAHLGTCLGVALYDNQAEVGGIAHFLLPEPPFTGIPDAPEKYASTGLPLIIDELLEQGASLERLTATVAGGALMIPVTRQDVNLDFGGRSADIVQEILHRKGIKISDWETGGFFACTLELDMKNGKSLVKPTWQQKTAPRTETYCEPLMDHIQDVVDRLQPIPQVALKLLRIMEYPGRTSSDLAEELGKDQVLAGRTLKISNSALFSRRMKIETLKDAVLVLGENRLIQSVITAAVKEYYDQPRVSGYSLCKGGLFHHAVGTALTAEKISNLTGRSTPGKAYTAGLLHDIGKVVIDQYLAGRALLFFRSRDAVKKDFIAIEKEKIGTTHCHAGFYLAAEWCFPDSVANVIKYHHHPEKTEKDKELVSIVFLAALFMSLFHMGIETERMRTEPTAEALRTLGLSFEDLAWLVDAIPASIFNIASLIHPTKDETENEKQ